MNKMTAGWNLRKLLAQKGIFSTSDLMPLLAERGIRISRTQTYRLVAETPNYVSLDLLVALCNILDCNLSDLITTVTVKEATNRAVGESRQRDPAAVRKLKPVRARVNGPKDK